MREKLQAEMSRILTAEAKGTWLLHLLRTAASLQSDRNLNCARVGGLNNSLTLGAPPTTLVTRTSVLDVPASDVLDQATARSGPEPRFLHPKPMLDKVQPPRIFSAARHAQTPDDDEKLVTPPPRLPARTPIYPSYPPAPRLCPSGASNYSPTQAHHIDAGRRHPWTPPWTSSLIVSQADVWQSIGQATSSHLHFVAMGDIPGVIYAIAILFSLLAIAATVLRFYARSIKKVGISWDDYAIIPALVFTIATAITMIVGAAIGDLGRHTEVMLVQNMEGEVAPMPILTHRTVVFQQTVYTTSLTQVLTFGFTKLAVLLFYQRIFQGKWFHRAVWLMIGVDFIWTVTFFFANLLQCYPIEINWTGVGNVIGKCIDTNRLMTAQCWTDVTSNLVILALPMPSIWAMQMSVRRKLAVCGIFLLGFMTVAAGLAKLVVVYNILYVVDNDLGLDPNSPVLDISWLQTSFVYWPMIESGVGIVGACLPLLRPLFAGAATRGFMRDLQSVDIPTSERSDTLWDKSGISGPMSEGWNSSVSTVRWGSDSMPAGDALREKRLPSLPTSSLNMLRDAPSEGPWMKGPMVRHDMI